MDKQHHLQIVDDKPKVDREEATAIDWCEKLARKFNAKKSGYRPKQRGYYNANRR